VVVVVSGPQRGESHHVSVLVGAESPPQKAVRGCALWSLDAIVYQGVGTVGSPQPVANVSSTQPSLFKTREERLGTISLVGHNSHLARILGGQVLGRWRQPMGGHGQSETVH
jgi:hypothetical protein